MNNRSYLTAFLRIVPVTSLVAVLPFVSCSNSDSIGRLSDGGSAGSGGNLVGSGGAGGSGVGGGTVSVGGAGGSGVGGTKSPTGGSAAGGVSGGAGGAAGSGGQGGRDAAVDGAQCVLTNMYCPYGYVTDAQGCPVGCAPAPGGTGGVGGTGGAGGTGGDNSEDVRSSDVQVSPDAQDLAALCTSTGGRIDSGLCCLSVGDFPDSCLGGACGCSPSNSHTVVTCSCPPGGGCFSTKTGCGNDGTVPDAGQDGNVACGSATCGAGEYCCNPVSSLCAPVGYGCAQGGGDDAQDVDSNGCTAEPSGDATNCGGSRPAHYYVCALTMLAAPCVTLSIGDVTNTFCCP